MSFPANMDPTRIPDDQWEFEGMSEDGLRRHYVHWVDKSRGFGFRKTENVIERDLLERNRELYNDSFGQRFGDGKVIASIPLNIFYRDIAPRLQEGDSDFLKWWHNRDENRPYRTFRGRI